MAQSKITGRKPIGLPGRGMWNPVSQAAAWAGGTREPGSETISYDLGWFWPAECEYIRVERTFSCHVQPLVEREEFATTEIPA